MNQNQLRREAFAYHALIIAVAYLKLTLQEHVSMHEFTHKSQERLTGSIGA